MSSLNEFDPAERDSGLLEVHAAPTAEKLTAAVDKILGNRIADKTKSKSAGKRSVADDKSSSEHGKKKSRHHDTQ